MDEHNKRIEDHNLHLEKILGIMLLLAVLFSGCIEQKELKPSNLSTPIKIMTVSELKLLWVFV